MQEQKGTEKVGVKKAPIYFEQITNELQIIQGRSILN